MHLLVTGGTGFLGRHLVRALLADGHPVRALGRNPAACAELTECGADVVAADLRDAAAVAAACAGVDSVCHAGALSAPWGRRADFVAVNVTGTANVVAGCARHRVRRLVYVSSPSVVFDGRHQVNLTERAPYPRHFASVYSWTKKLGEDLVNRAHRDRGGRLETVILRPKAIFGPGDTSLLPRLLAAARAGRLPVIGDGGNEVDLTYVANAVHAVRLALTAPAAAGRTYHVTGGEHVPLWPLITDILGRLGVPAKLRRVPFGIVYAAAACMEAQAALLGGEPLLTRYTAAILARTQTYDIAAARRDLAYEPVVSVADGVEATVAALAGPAAPAARQPRGAGPC